MKLKNVLNTVGTGFFVCFTVIVLAVLSPETAHASQIIWDPGVVRDTFGPGDDISGEGDGPAGGEDTSVSLEASAGKVGDSEDQSVGVSRDYAVYPPDSYDVIGDNSEDTSTENKGVAQGTSTDGQSVPAEGQTTVPIQGQVTPSDYTSPDQNVDYDTLALANSFNLKNTPVPSTQANIVFINGRAIDLLRPVIALTYDDGPMESTGNQIMNIMAAYGARCTFFLVGERVPMRASEVQRMVTEGHEVANHTYSHTYLNKVSAQQIIDQVTACNNIIEQVTGVRPTVMRLPGGNKNQTVLSNVNMPIILWNIDTRDWKTRDAQSTINAVIGRVKSGDIVLMHELYQSTVDATTVIVPTLVNQGFQLVTVSEMAALKGIALSPNTVYYSM